MPSAKPKGRILLAEDNEINQEIAIELLEHVGVEVTVASNGQEAVDLFLERDFDLILMDIQMPLMDGADATRAIRTSGKAGADAIPILAMTAHAMSSDREKSLNAGMNDHLTKPIDPQALYAALDVWLPESVRPLAKEPADMPEPSAFPPSAVSATQAAPTEMKPQDILFSLQGLDAQAGLSNVAGNRELYLRLLDRFANNYRNSSAELRDALQRMKYDASAHEEAVRLAHTAKGVAANLGASALAAVAAELESAIKKNNVREDMLARYEMLLREALDSIEALPKLDDVYVGQKAISDSDKKRITAVLDVLPNLMQTDWYSAQQRLLALAPVVQDTAVSAHFREITMALEEFDSESVAEKGKSLLAAI
jgi:CheY-like chemotaxis protein/HPt (histidine-containing phosphotransfer) domain-containing protein